MSAFRPLAALAASALFCAPAAHAQQILQNFTGSNINNSQGYIPPDTQGAAGLSSYVELVNGRYAVYNQTGGATLQSSSLDSFWANAGITTIGATFDPRVVYDPTANRYYASALDFGTTSANGNHQNNNILLAVSNTSDPTQGWKAIKIAASQGADNYFADYDTLGFNGDGVYVSVNNFPTQDPFGDDPDENLPALDPSQTGQQNATSYGVSLLTVPKTSLTAQTTANTTLFYNQNPNNTGFVAHPAVDQDATNGASGTEYIFSDYNTPAGFNKVSIINGPASAPTLTTAGGFVTVTAYNNPPTASQPNGDNTIDAGDTRFGATVVKNNGELWAVQDVSLGGRAALKWIRINASTGAIIGQGIIGDASHDYYSGSIAVNKLGNVVIGYTRSGATEFASSYASVGAYTASSVTFQNPLLLKAGVANYDVTYGGTRNRWGDYSATTLDPNDPTKFWTSQEWASGTNIWSTQITQIGIAAAPEPAGWAALLVGAGMLGAVAARRRRIA